MSAQTEETKRLLDEADQLLYIAYIAFLKLGLARSGSDIGLSHEVRMFALYFSKAEQSGPGALQIEGNGRYDEWRKALRESRQTK